MSTGIINPGAFIRTAREFPEELHQLSFEVNKAYLDTANAVNSRTVGLFPVNRPAITGDAYFITSVKQQTLRQVYSFTTTTAIDHGIKNVNPGQFTKHTGGTYTDGIDSFGLPFATSVAVAGLITFYVTTTQIIFVLGAGAPALTSGFIVLEWLVKS